MSPFIHVAALAAAMTVFAAAPAGAIDCFDHSAYSSWIESDVIPGDSSESILIGDFLYVAAGTGGVSIFDVSDPDRTESFTGTLTSGTANDVDKFDALLLVADGSAGLSLFDVSNPAAPQLITTLPLPAPALGVAFGFPGELAQAAALVACGDAGLVLVDCTDITSPEVLGALDTPGLATEVLLDGDIAYVADASGGLQIVDVSDPSQPAGIGESPLIHVTDLALDGVHLYAVGSSALSTIDVTDPTHPIIVSTAPAPASGRDVVVDQDRLAVAGFSALLVFDRSNPSAPTALGSVIPGASAPQGVALRGARAYTCAGPNGLETFRLTDTFAGPSVTVLASGFGIGSVAAGDRVYVLGTTTVRVYDVSTATPSFLGTFDPPGGAIHKIDAEGSLLYVVSIGLPLRIFDVTVPSAPSLLASVPCPVGYFTGVDVSGGVAAISGSEGLTVADVATPAASEILSFLPHPSAEHEWAVAVEGELAVLAMRYNPGVSGIRVVDIADPAAPVQRGWIAFPGGPDVTSDLAVSGTSVFLANETVGAPIIDISDPDFPVHIADIPFPMPVLDVAVEGSILSVTGSRVGIIDVSDPASPRTIGVAPAPAGTFGVAAIGSTLVLSGTFGTALLPAQCTTATAAPQFPAAIVSPHLAVFPNPMRGMVASVSFDAPRAASIALDVVDVSGRRVRELRRGPHEGGAARTVWDARDERGQRVAAGVYFLRLETPSGRATQKVVLSQ